MRQQRFVRILGLASLAGGLLACTADVIGTMGSPPGAGPSGAGSSGMAGVGGATAPVLGPQPSARLHKLTAAEVTNSLHDLLGAVPTLLKAMGSTETSWGKDEAHVDQILPDLLAP